MPNPQKPRIILIDRCEKDADGRGTFLKVYALDGQVYRIGEKRASLWTIFESSRKGEPLLAIFETYNNVEYIANARPIADELTKRAIEDLGLKLADAQREERNRSTSLSYAKDLCVADKIDLKNIKKTAEDFYSFIKAQ